MCYHSGVFVRLEQPDDTICPFCEEPLERDALLVDCPACGAAHHTGCWQDNRGCANPNCAGQDQQWMNGSPGKKKNLITPPQRSMKPEEDPAARLTTPGGRVAPPEPEGPPPWLTPVLIGVVCFVFGFITANLTHRAPEAAPTSAPAAQLPTETEPTSASAIVTQMFAFEKSGQVYLQHPNDTAPVQFTQKGGGSPTFSGDCGKVLYVCKGVWSANADGTNAHPLTNDNDKQIDRDPIFSPDGLQIVFTRDSGKSGDLMGMKSDGNSAAAIVKAKDDEWWLGPSFSADGKLILATLWDKTAKTGQLYMVTPDGKTLTKVLALPEMARAVFTADGKGIVYCRNTVPADGSLKAGLYTANLDGTAERCLVPMTAVDSAGTLDAPACSADGKLLAFTAYLNTAAPNTTADGAKNPQSPSVIYTVNPDGSDLKKLGDGKCPAWGKTR